VNVDGYPDSNVDYLLDLSRRLPIPDNSFDGIFCEHVLEHFDLDDGTALLCECHRILRPGGIVRIIMPDAERIIDEYVHNPKGLAARRQVASGLGMEAVNSYFRQRYEHRCLYDFELARHALARAGFDQIKSVRFRVGRRPELLLDDEKYEWESIYIEASKADPL
jgi:predicted SAM-dependent methyltransferase